MADGPDNPILTERLAEVLERLEEHLLSMRKERVKSPQDWLTLDEAADELRVSRDTVERLVASGQIRAVTIETPRSKGRRSLYRIQRTWIDDYMQTRVRPTTPPVRPIPRRRRHSRPDHDFIG